MAMNEPLQNLGFGYMDGVHLSSCLQKGPCWTRRDPSDPSSPGCLSQADSPESWESWRSSWETPGLRHQQRDPVD